MIKVIKSTPVAELFISGKDYDNSDYNLLLILFIIHVLTEHVL